MNLNSLFCIRLVTGTKCVMNFADQMTHYLDVWRSKETVKTTNQRCVEPSKMNIDFATEFQNTVSSSTPQNKTFQYNSNDSCATSAVGRIYYITFEPIHL